MIQNTYSSPSGSFLEQLDNLLTLCSSGSEVFSPADQLATSEGFMAHRKGECESYGQLSPDISVLNELGYGVDNEIK